MSLRQALDAWPRSPPAASRASRSVRSGCGTTCSGSLTPEAVGLGAAPLGSIDIADEGADEPGDTNLDDWCEWLSGPPVNCTNAATLQPDSVLSTSLRGVPLGSIPLGSIPLGSIPLGSIPLGSIPLGSIDIEFSPLGSIPLGSIPLGSIPLGSIPLGSIPLGSIDLQRSPLGSIPLGSIPLGSIPTLFTCTPTCPTGGVLATIGAAEAELTLETPDAGGRLGRARQRHRSPTSCSGSPRTTLDGYTVRQLVETLLLIPGNELTFADLLAAFLAESSLGWERLNLERRGVNAIAADGGTARYAVEVQLTPDSPVGSGRRTRRSSWRRSPGGFTYVPARRRSTTCRARATEPRSGTRRSPAHVLSWTLR